MEAFKTLLLEENRSGHRQAAGSFENRDKRVD